MGINLKITPANDIEGKKIRDTLHLSGYGYIKTDNYYLVPCPDPGWLEKIKFDIQDATDAKAEYIEI